MTNEISLLDNGFECLIDRLGVVDAEYFLYLVKSDRFDYTVWQREYFDKMPLGEFTDKAFAYDREHPYTGKGQIL